MNKERKCDLYIHNDLARKRRKPRHVPYMHNAGDPYTEQNKPDTERKHYMITPGCGTERSQFTEAETRALVSLFLVWVTSSQRIGSHVCVHWCMSHFAFKFSIAYK